MNKIKSIQSGRSSECVKCRLFQWETKYPAIYTDSIGNTLCHFHAGPDAPANVKQAVPSLLEELVRAANAANTTCNLSGSIFTEQVIISNYFNAPSINFDQCFFLDGADFSGTNFQGKEHINFDYCVFEKEARFDNSAFTRGASFKLTRFHGNCSFTKCKFNKIIDFFGATFTRQTNLNMMTVNDAEEIIFSFARFEAPANFRLSTFHAKETKFEHALFTDIASFHITKFLSLNFQGTTFRKEAFFIGAEFKNTIKIDRCTFKNDVDFSHLTAYKKLSIFNTKFTNTPRVDFSNAKINCLNIDKSMFSGIVKFTRTTILSHFRITNTELRESVLISDCKFFMSFSVYRTIFYHTLQIDRTQFGIILNFTKNIFHKNIFFWSCKLPNPEAYSVISFARSHGIDGATITIENASLDTFRTFDVELELFKFNNCKWPKDKDGFSIVFEENAPHQHLQHKTLEVVYRKLKKGSLASRSEFQASDWHYKEKEHAEINLNQESNDRSWRSHLFKATYFLYGLFSGYGEKPERALSWLITALALPFTTYTVSAIIQTGLHISIDWELFKTVVYKSFLYIPLLKMPSPAPLYTKINLSSFEFIMIALSQISITILTTLFLLALRNRFRR